MSAIDFSRPITCTDDNSFCHLANYAVVNVVNELGSCNSLDDEKCIHRHKLRP